MNIQNFICNPFQENTYIVYDDTREALLIDPGFYNETEWNKAKDFIQSNRLLPKRLINTHLHLDHCLGNGFVERDFRISAEVGEKDLFLIQGVEKQAALFGLEIHEKVPQPRNFLKEGDIIEVGKMSFQVLEVPGHSPGSLALYETSESVLFSGDVLFQGGRGRTDLFCGDEATLLKSIREKLLVLDAKTVVCCGHGAATTIAAEKFLY